jgi:hypothetical protein
LCFRAGIAAVRLLEIKKLAAFFHRGGIVARLRLRVVAGGSTMIATRMSSVKF